MAAGDARPIPLKNTAYRLTAVIYDQEGDLVGGAAGLDSEVSLDGAAFADCSAEATEIGTTGFYTLDLTAAEMNADTVAVQIKTSTVGAKTTALVLYPAESSDIVVTVATNNDKTGYALSGAGVTAVQSGLATGADLATVDGNVDTILTRTDVATSTRLASAGYTAPPTVGDIATAVWASATRSLTEISATLRNQIADNVIRRAYANAASSADGDAKTGRSILGVIARLTNRSAIAGATLTVYEADDTTALFTQTLTTDATAEPVIDANTV